MIPFTQFLLPHGERRETGIERSPEIEHLAEELIKAGCRFEIEMLSTGMINMDCQDKNGELISCQLSPNGPGIEEKVDELVRDSYKLFNDKSYLNSDE